MPKTVLQKVSPDDLKNKLARVRKFFDLRQILAVSPSLESIAAYYRVNKLAYSLLHSHAGFIHLGLSQNNTVRKEDLLGQVKLVEEYIGSTGAKRVLELACGRGSNSLYLAKKFPEVGFHGVDLPNGHLELAIKGAKSVDNFHPIEGDFHDLSEFPVSHFNLVFVIESLCHSSNKDKVVQEVVRVLKPGGLFVVFDGFAKKPLSEFNQTEALAKQLVERGMWVGNFDYLDDFKSCVSEAGLLNFREEDLTGQVLPTLRKYEKLSKKLVFNAPILGWLIIKFFPREFTYNAISGYLMPDLIQQGLASYMMLVAKKKVI